MISSSCRVGIVVGAFALMSCSSDRPSFARSDRFVHPDLAEATDDSGTVAASETDKTDFGDDSADIQRGDASMPNSAAGSGASADESHSEVTDAHDGASESSETQDERAADPGSPRGECTENVDCGETTDCLRVECVDGLCAEVALPRNTPCNAGVCDGVGACVDCTADEHCPTAGCTAGQCIDDVCVISLATAGSACGAEGNLVCSAVGACVGCVTAQDCGEAPQCSVYTCSLGGECVLEALQLGASASDSIAGDCRSRQCDGSGNTLLVVDDARCDDGLFCNGQEVCLDDGSCAPASENPCAGHDVGPECDDSCDEEADECVAADERGTSCGPGRCDGEGICADCLSDADCDGQLPRCHEGSCVECIELADCMPVDCSNVSCVEFGCASEPADEGTACGQAGDLLCNGVGTCVGCVSAEDCGEPPQCSEFVCSEAGECLLEPSAVGSFGDEPPAGDCRLRQCDGNGNVLLVPDDASCDDGLFCNGRELCQGDGSCIVPGTNPCAGHDVGPACADSCDEASDACSAPDASGVSCPDGSCDGLGACVACLSDGDCDGLTPYCSTEGDCVQCLAATHCAPAAGDCYLAQVCSSDGVCEDRFVTEGASCGSSVSSACTAPDECDGNGNCLPRNAAPTTSCDDGDPCSSASECDGAGACLATALTCSGPGEVCTPTGNCVCDVGYRSCADGCIPEDDCCDSSECGDDASCQDSQCVCNTGYKTCDVTGECIANNRCCDDDDCNPGQVCGSAGGFCTCPDNGYGQEVLITGSVPNCEWDQYRLVRGHPCGANDGTGYDYYTCDTNTCAWSTTESTCCTAPSGPPCPWM